MYQRFAILLSAGALAVTVACSQTDTGITSAVKSKMAADDTVKASEINVDTHNHVVTLNGTVGSKAEKDRAVMIARNTNGVNSVVDDLRVGSVARPVRLSATATPIAIATTASRPSRRLAIRRRRPKPSRMTRR